MASNQTLCVFSPLHNQPPASNYAPLGLRNAHPTLDFDPSTNQDAVFGGILPRNYSGGGITLTLVWCAASATTGNCGWKAALERLQDGVDDLDADSFASFQSSSFDAAPGTNGVTKYSTITFTHGAQMDSLAVGEAFRLKVQRDASNASDTMAGSAQLLRAELRET
jgi:hypothetical protein